MRRFRQDSFSQSQNMNGVYFEFLIKSFWEMGEVHGQNCSVLLVDKVFGVTRGNDLTAHEKYLRFHFVEELY